MGGESSQKLSLGGDAYPLRGSLLCEVMNSVITALQFIDKS
jgi:hypothetical protein